MSLSSPLLPQRAPLSKSSRWYPAKVASSPVTTSSVQRGWLWRSARHALQTEVVHARRCTNDTFIMMVVSRASSRASKRPVPHLSLPFSMGFAAAATARFVCAPANEVAPWSSDSLPTNTSVVAIAHVLSLQVGGARSFVESSYSPLAASPQRQQP